MLLDLSQTPKHAFTVTYVALQVISGLSPGNPRVNLSFKPSGLFAILPTCHPTLHTDASGGL